MPNDNRPTHPRPQLRRKTWTSLDGDWQFAVDQDAIWRLPREVNWERTIRVPFAPETKASGVGETGFYKSCWYRRVINVPTPVAGERIHLHFGAVDYAATV